MNHHAVAFYAYKAECYWACLIPLFLALDFPSFPATRCANFAPHSMPEETATNPPPVNPPINDDDARNDSGSESAVRATSSSPTRRAALMADGKIPEMFDFFKKTMVTDAERQGYHDLG
jgi:hypothetical protein